jgi:hypothetical protein
VKGDHPGELDARQQDRIELHGVSLAINVRLARRGAGPAASGRTPTPARSTLRLGLL